MALARPQRTQRLVLCNALADYRTNTWRKWLEAYAQLALVRAIGVRRTSQIIARRMFPREEQAPMRRRVIDVVGANPKSAYVATINALIGWSALERLPAVHAPTLIIAAEHDYTPLAQRHVEATRFPRAEMTVIAGSRHGTPFDATERFNACVLDFLARHRDAPA
jgi:3-oxoadipate enol-lactonase